LVIIRYLSEELAKEKGQFIQHLENILRSRCLDLFFLQIFTRYFL